MVIEAKKSCTLLSASWRASKASGITQSESKGLATNRRANEPTLSQTHPEMFYQFSDIP